MVKDEYEKVATELIANAGMARSNMLSAINAAREGDFEKVVELKKEADEFLTQAHFSQTTLLQQEVRGEAMEVTLLMVHAQDHLMTAITVKELASELIKEIEIRKRNNRNG